MNDKNIQDIYSPASGHRHIRPTIGLLLPGIGYANEELIWIGARDASRAYNVNLITITGGHLRDPDGFLKQANVLYDLIRPGRFHGMMIYSSTVGWYINQEELAAFCGRYHPLPQVSLDTVVAGIPSVIKDEYNGIRDVLIHLIEIHGYRRIAFLRGQESHVGIEERYRAYCDTMALYGLPVDPTLISPPQQGWDQVTAVSLMEGFIREHHLSPGQDFEAIVAATDNLALNAIKVLQARGLRIPQDVAVTGFDDEQKSRVITPPLTTVPAPFYEMGWRGVEIFLSLWQGEDAPPKVVIPAELVVRQSCGCQSPVVLQADAEVEIRNEKLSTLPISCEPSLDAKRVAIIAGIVDMIGVSDKDQVRAQAERLVEVFIAELQQTSPGTFLVVLEDILQQVSTDGSDVAVWQNAISILRRRMLPVLSDILLARAENIWGKARVLIGEVAQRTQAYQSVQAEQRAQALRELGAVLITTFEFQGLMDILVAGLPGFGIPGCYLALYDNPQAPTEGARLILAYDCQGCRDIDIKGYRFPSIQLIPDEFFPRERWFDLVLMPLYFRAQQIGFVLLESGLREGNIYEALRSQVSSALQGALLVQKVNEHTQELEASNEKIRILNEQLKDDNIRMHTEMDLARRIQTALLPPMDKHLHSDFEITAVMLPAEEVGGDYYDITIDQEGNLWFSIGDVSGHGVTPGLIMMMAQTVHTTITTNYHTSASEIVCMINKVLYKNVHSRLGEDHYMTFTTLKYLGKGRFQHAGSHLDLIVYRKQLHTCELIDTPGVWLNFMPDIEYCTANDEFTLEIGDLLVLYTDGLTEAWNAQDELLGLDRFVDIVIRHAEEEIDTCRGAIIKDVLGWCAGNQQDDMSLVVVRRVG